MFLVPPLTFIYLSNHWKKLKKPALRVVEPAVTIALVVVAFTFVPSLRSKAGGASGDLKTRLVGGGEGARKGDRGRGRQGQGARFEEDRGSGGREGGRAPRSTPRGPRKGRCAEVEVEIEVPRRRDPGAHPGRREARERDDRRVREGRPDEPLPQPRASPMDPANGDDEVIDLEPTMTMTLVNGDPGLPSYATRHSAPVELVEAGMASLAGETHDLLRHRLASAALFLAGGERHHLRLGHPVERGALARLSLDPDGRPIGDRRRGRGRAPVPGDAHEGAGGRRRDRPVRRPDAHPLPVAVFREFEADARREHPRGDRPRQEWRDPDVCTHDPLRDVHPQHREGRRPGGPDDGDRADDQHRPPDGAARRRAGT